MILKYIKDIQLTNIQAELLTKHSEFVIISWLPKFYRCRLYCSFTVNLNSVWIKNYKINQETICKEFILAQDVEVFKYVVKTVLWLKVLFNRIMQRESWLFVHYLTLLIKKNYVKQSLIMTDTFRISILFFFSSTW